MSCLKIPRGGKVIVVGDIHEHEEQVDKLFSEITPSDKTLLVSVGDIYEKGFGQSAAESIVDRFREFCDKGLAYVIRGNHELRCIRQAKRKKKMTKHLEWFSKQPLCVPVEFHNRTRLVIVHGGVKPLHTWDDLRTDIETCYIRNLDEDGNPIKRVRRIIDDAVLMEDEKPGGHPWHEVYDGRFGYIASGHASLKDGVPRFYNYSCNLDTAVYCTGKLTAQTFTAEGREELLTFEGQAKHP